MSLEDRMKQEFMEGLAEGFAGVPMEFPEGIRPIGEFTIEGERLEGERAGEIDSGPPQISPNLDDEVIDAEIIE